MNSTMLALLIPILLIWITLLSWGLYDLTRPDRKVLGDNRALWALAIIFVSMLGPVLYFAVGRKED